MSAAASLSLLKGGKTAVDDELQKETTVPEASTEPEAEQVEVEIENMNSAQVDALVAEHGIETPTGWAKFKLAEKKAWLNEQFGDTEGTEPANEAPDDPPAEPVGHPVETAAEKAAAKKKAAADKKAAAKAAPAPTTEAPDDHVAVALAGLDGTDEPVGKEVAVAEPVKAPAKKKAGKAEQTIEQKGDDELADLIHEVENMDESTARSTVIALSDESELTMFKLGGVLSVIQSNSWFAPYASFREYVEKEVGLHYRKATYWAAIYNHLSESKVPWEKVKGLGWTKLKEIAEILTPENVEDWVKIAMSQTTLQLIETVKAHKAAANAPGQITDQAKTVTTKTFKVHEDQKATIDAALVKAKEQSGTEYDTAALEFICLDYMGSQSTADKLKAMGVEKALEVLEKAFPGVDFAVSM